MVIYIYALAHPETGEIRYIGKSIQPEKRERIITAIRAAAARHKAEKLAQSQQA